MEDALAHIMSFLSDEEERYTPAFDIPILRAILFPAKTGYQVRMYFGLGCLCLASLDATRFLMYSETETGYVFSCSNEHCGFGGHCACINYRATHRPMYYETRIRTTYGVTVRIRGPMVAYFRKQITDFMLLGRPPADATNRDPYYWFYQVTRRVMTDRPTHLRIDLDATLVVNEFP